MTRITLDVEFYVETCCVKKCGITWAVPDDFNRNRKDDHELFYCPNGHPQHYPQLSDKERLKKQLDRCSIQKNNWRDKAERRQRSQRSLRGHITKLKNAMRQDPNGDESAGGS